MAVGVLAVGCIGVGLVAVGVLAVRCIAVGILSVRCISSGIVSVCGIAVRGLTVTCGGTLRRSRERVGLEGLAHAAVLIAVFLTRSGGRCRCGSRSDGLCGGGFRHSGEQFRRTHVGDALAFRLGHRESEPECRASAFAGALDSDFTVHCRDDVFADGQSETHALLLVGVGHVALEDLVLFVFGDADAGVFYKEIYVVVLVDFISERDRAFRCELACVGEEIDEHLAESLAVGHYLEFGHAEHHVEHRVGLHAEFDRVAHGLEDLVDVDLGIFVFQRAGLDLVHVEHVVDELLEQLGVCLDDCAEFLLLFRVGGVHEEFREPEYGVERRADLVAHVGEERGLCVGHLLGLRDAVGKVLAFLFEVGDVGDGQDHVFPAVHHGVFPFDADIHLHQSDSAEFGHHQRHLSGVHRAFGIERFFHYVDQ